MCYLRLFGDCRSFLGRTQSNQSPPTPSNRLINIADTQASLKTDFSPTKSVDITENQLVNQLESLLTDSQSMDTNEFRKRGRQMVDYIADYLETISHRRVTPNVEPGYLKNLLSSNAPNKSEDWDSIMRDFDKFIMPGMTHWQHPRFHAYFPAGNSYPSILADMLSDAIGCVGFSWVCHSQSLST
jgi:hypothetical protein